MIRNHRLILNIKHVLLEFIAKCIYLPQINYGSMIYQNS
jgi:hypothetical protein